MNEQAETLWQFMQNQSGKILSQLVAHTGLTFISLFIAMVIAIPLGIFIAKKGQWATPVLGITGILQTIPSIALLGFMIPLLGIGAKPAIVALMLYALLPIVRNTYTGIRGVPPAITDAAKGMGMTAKQILWKVELPLAFPVMLAGIRTAAVINVGVATLAAYIAAGGLGEFIFGGIALNNSNMILAGAIPAALLAIAIDFLLSLAQKIKPQQLNKKFWLLPLAMLLLSSFYLVPNIYGNKMLAGFTPEFMGRQDGYLGLQKVYDLQIPNVVISDAVMYKAAFEKELSVISGYSTDGRLKAYNLITLTDDKKIFPPYYVAPVISNNMIAKHPELVPILNKLAGRINDSTMTALNYQVDYLKQAPEKVAKDFLVSQGLYAPPKTAGDEVINIGSKIFGEQYVLAAMYSMLIQAETNLNVKTKTGLGGTKICFDALVNKQIDMYPEYTGTALLVILNANDSVISACKGDKQLVYNYVKTAFEKQFQLTWLAPVGFNNTYALMMRREEASEKKITTISQLSAYIKNKKQD